MDCTKIQDCIAEYAVGLLTGRARADVAAHLRECPTCRAEFEKQEQVMRMVEQAEPVEPPAGLWNGVYNRITATPVHSTIWSRLREGRYHQWRRRSLGFSAVGVTALVIYLATRSIAPPAVGVEAQEYIRGHAIYASQAVLADQTALYAQAVMAETAHMSKDQTE